MFRLCPNQTDRKDDRQTSIKVSLPKFGESGSDLTFANEANSTRSSPKPSISQVIKIDG